MANANANVALLKLPAEIRNHIYQLTLLEDQPIKVQSGDNAFPHPGILTACKQLRKETKRMYYRCNTFDFILGLHVGNKYPVQWQAELPLRFRVLFEPNLNWPRNPVRVEGSMVRPGYTAQGVLWW